MQDSGGADTWGWEILITSAVAMLFSCSNWDKRSLRVPCALGRTTRAFVRKYQAPSALYHNVRKLALEGTTGRWEKFLKQGLCDYIGKRQRGEWVGEVKFRQRSTTPKAGSVWCRAALDRTAEGGCPHISQRLCSF